MSLFIRAISLLKLALVNILSKTEAVDSLTTLMDENQMLQKEECEKRIIRWGN